MNNEFNILWVEDQKEIIDGKAKLLKANLNNQFHIDTKFDKKNSSKQINYNDLCNQKYDLILMDYSLRTQDSEQGDEIIKKIREHEIYTDIIFYSSNYMNLLNIVKTNPEDFQGTYFVDFSQASDFEKMIFNIISKIIRKSENIVNLRGYFLDKAADYEKNLNEIIVSIMEIYKLSQLNEEVENEIKTFLKEKFNDYCIDQEKKIEKYKISKLLNNKINVAQKLSIINKILPEFYKSFDLETPDYINHFKTFYTNNVSHYRNALGHKKIENNVLIINQKERPIDDNLFKEIRDIIKKCDDTFENINKNIEETKNLYITAENNA